MTSPARLLDVVLACLRELDVPWAVPQGEAALEAVLAGGGDLDLVAAVPAEAVVDRLLQVQDEVRVIALNQYDIGRGDAFWCVDRAATCSIAVDVLCDPRGSGRLGIPTSEVLRSREAGDVPATSEAWRVAYLVSKRVAKQQWERLPPLRTDADAAELLQALALVFGPAAGRRAAALVLEGRASADDWRAAGGALRHGRQQQRRARAAAGTAGLGALHVRRAAARLRRPVGAWVHVHGDGSEAVADDLASSVGAALVHRLVGELGAVDRLAVARVVSRPGLAVTWSPGPDVPRRPGPVLVLGPDGHATARERVVEALQERLVSRRRSAPQLPSGRA